MDICNVLMHLGPCEIPRPCVAIGLQGRCSIVPSMDVAFAGANLWKDSPSYRFINIAKVYRHMNIEFHSWVQKLWIILAKNAQVKTLEANEYVGGLAHCIMDFIPLQSISREGPQGIEIGPESLGVFQGLGVFLWFGICPEYRPEQFQFITGGDLATWLAKWGGATWAQW